MKTRERAWLVVAGTLLAASALYGAKEHRAKEAGLSATAKARADTPRVTADGTLLPSGWVLHPAGRQIPIGDMPLAMCLSPDGRRLLVSTGGFRPCQIVSINTDDEQVQVTQTLDQTWEGMAFGPAGDTLYVSGGGRGLLWRFGYIKSGGDLIRQEPLSVADLKGRPAPYSRESAAGANAWVAGPAFGQDGTLYALNVPSATLYALDPETGKAKATALTGDHPNAVAVSPDGREVWVTNQGGGAVSVFGAGTLAKVAEIPVGKQPVALLFSPDGKRLYVADSGSDSVSVLDTASYTVRQTIRTSLFPQSPTGSTPDALALSPDARTLFVTNADNNDVAVIDVSAKDESRVLGFIPTGWYPSALALSLNGKTLYVGVGKGLHFAPNATATNPYTQTDPIDGRKYDYIGGLLNGAVSVVPVPNPHQLYSYTRQVMANTPGAIQKTAQLGVSVLPTLHKIKHVLYVIRENRTYDQVLGDIQSGNGDPNLTIFGAQTTPNAHALAAHYTLLDNLYANGEVSEDGHKWCDQAYVTDYIEKAWPNSYSGRGEPDGDARVADSPAGAIWDNCRRHGLTYRSYGEAADFKSTPDAPPTFVGDKGLAGHVNLEWSKFPFGVGRDTQRAQLFLAELHQAEKTGQWPQFMVAWLPEDHTKGLTAGAFTPTAAVASNDQALGMIVDGISHSRFWRDTAIFVIEDDAQNGPDHVDAHRTVGLVISPYVKRNTVDSTLYTTASFIRTMEMILKLPPMTQYDRAAPPLFGAFTPQPDMTAYVNQPAHVNLEARNPDKGPGAQASARLDFSDADRADPDALNAILWHALKPGIRQPAPVRSVRLAR
ncbi:MAG: beta-propeller fold lactonase family protein [Armatimonadota bacterium]|nr:beta-propeller fold lactonase family protein [Armatimonadota bacterium]